MANFNPISSSSGPPTSFSKSSSPDIERNSSPKAPSPHFSYQNPEDEYFSEQGRKIEELVEKLLSCNSQKSPSKEEGRDLCFKIKNQRFSLEDSVNLAINYKINQFTINAFFVKNSQYQENDSWEFKNELLRQLPSDLRTVANLNTMISQAGRHEDFDLADELFQELLSRKLENEITYRCYIDAASRNGQFEKIKHAFEGAVHQRMATVATVNLYITAAEIERQFPEAQSAFCWALGEDIANETTYGNYIEIAGKNGQFLEAKNAFELAEKKGIAGSAAYANYILAAGRNGQFAEAKYTFDQAVQLGIVDNVICNNYIDAAGKNGQPEESKNVLNLAIKLKIADAVTYNSYINICAKNGQPEESKRVFDLAVQEEIANKTMYMVYVDCLIQYGKEEEAEELFQALQQKFHWSLSTKKQRKLRMIDLHGYSYGAGYLALKQFMTVPHGPKRFGVISGKGCQENGNYLTFRNYLAEMIHCKWPHLICEPDPRNDGVLLIDRRVNIPGKSKLPEEKTSLPDLTFDSISSSDLTQ